MHQSTRGGFLHEYCKADTVDDGIYAFQACPVACATSFILQCDSNRNVTIAFGMDGCGQWTIFPLRQCCSVCIFADANWRAPALSVCPKPCSQPGPVLSTSAGSGLHLLPYSG
jgi:hypothetical protein